MYTFTLFSSYLVFTSLPSYLKIFTSASQLILYLDLTLQKKVKYFIYSGVSEQKSVLQVKVWLLFDLFHSFCMILLTEFKIKWLVNPIAFFGALFFLIPPRCGWTAAPPSALPSDSIKLHIFIPLIYLLKQKTKKKQQQKSCFCITVDIFPVF